MKKLILYLVLLLSTNFLFAQGSLTFNPVVPIVTDGVVDFTFDLVGGGAQYDLSVEVSFDNGSTWDDIPAAYITGALNNVVPASGISLQWNAMAGFPGQVTNQAVLRVTARHVSGTDFTFTYRGSSVTYGTVLKDYGGTIGEKCWFDRNLGATQVATTSDDAASYGDLFQWGRLDDGHQDRASTTTSTLSTTDDPGHNHFIIIPVSTPPNDWRVGQNDDLWQEDGTGINNPCPPGWRVPTQAELQAEIDDWSSSDASGAFNSSLKWTVAGRRNYDDGSFGQLGSHGLYWSSTVHSTVSRNLFFSGSANSASVGTDSRAYGFSVRCIKD